MKSLDAAGVQIKPTKVVAILPHNEGIELQDAAAPETGLESEGPGAFGGVGGRLRPSTPATGKIQSIEASLRDRTPEEKETCGDSTDENYLEEVGLAFDTQYRDPSLPPAPLTEGQFNVVSNYDRFFIEPVSARFSFPVDLIDSVVLEIMLTYI
jgi:hypothetical protein